MPTDLEILTFICDEYYKAFTEYNKDVPTRITKTYIPVDITRIATFFDVDDDIIFGRLYYHLNDRYGYKQSDGSTVNIFQNSHSDPRTKQQEIHAVNFSYMTSVLASLQDEHREQTKATNLAIISIIISVASAVAALIALFTK